jgi:hypothetical protein
MFLRNVGNHSPIETASQPRRRQEFSLKPLWKSLKKILCYFKWCFVSICYIAQNKIGRRSWMLVGKDSEEDDHDLIEISVSYRVGWEKSQSADWSSAKSRGVGFRTQLSTLGSILALQTSSYSKRFQMCYTIVTIVHSLTPMKQYLHSLIAISTCLFISLKFKKSASKIFPEHMVYLLTYAKCDNK